MVSNGMFFECNQLTQALLNDDMNSSPSPQCWGSRISQSPPTLGDLGGEGTCNLCRFILRFSNAPTQSWQSEVQMAACPLIFLIGIPGSGKSSIAAQLIQEIPQCRIISTDNIRGQLFGDPAVQGSWQLIWQEVGNQFRQAVCQIAAGEVAAAIYDATNAVRRQRRQAIAHARECGFTHLTGLWVNTPLWLCLERNQQRDRQVPEAVIRRMHRRLQGAPPTLVDGLDRLVTHSAV